MRFKKNVSSISKLITYVIVLVLLALTVGTIAFFTNGFTDDFKTFYIEYNGKKYVKAEENLFLADGRNHRFDCKYTFGKLVKDEPKGYTVKIVPHTTEETDFEFTVDGITYKYSKESDLTKGFNIDLQETFFIISLPCGIELQDVLQKIYSGKEVAVPDSLRDTEYYFTLTVSSYNNNVTYRFNFNFETLVSDITIHPGNIVF